MRTTWVNAASDCFAMRSAPILISAAVGLVATQWLAVIPEPGKTGRMLWEFQEELALPFRRSRSTAAVAEHDVFGV